MMVSQRLKNNAKKDKRIKRRKTILKDIKSQCNTQKKRMQSQAICVS